MIEMDGISARTGRIGRNLNGQSAKGSVAAQARDLAVQPTSRIVRNALRQRKGWRTQGGIWSELDSAGQSGRAIQRNHAQIQPQHLYGEGAEYLGGDGDLES